MREASTGNRAAMHRCAYLLSPEWFHSVPVHAGDMMVFSQSIPHFGVRNRNQHHTRIVLFSQLSTNPKEDDENQYFSWMYVRDAYGPMSLRFAQALVEAKQYTPVERYYDEQIREQAVKALIKHKLAKPYGVNTKLIDKLST